MTQNSFISVQQTLPTRSRTWSRGFSAPARLIARWFKDYLRRRRDQRKLEALPDYLLEDVGLCRADLKRSRWL